MVDGANDRQEPFEVQEKARLDRIGAVLEHRAEAGATFRAGDCSPMVSEAWGDA